MRIPVLLLPPYLASVGMRAGGAAALLASAALLGCAAPEPVPLDSALAQQRDTPSQWLQAPATALAPAPAPVDWRSWWLPLGDAQLNALVEHALAHNLELAQLRSRLSQQQQLAQAVPAAYRPNLDASVRTLQDVSATDSFFQASINMIWDLGLFGAGAAHQESAQAQVHSAQAQLQAARVALVAEVVRRYLEIRLAQQQRGLLHAQAQLDEQAAHLAQVRARQQLGPQQQVQHWQAQADQHGAEAAGLYQAQAQAAHRLALLLGRSQPEPDWLQATQATQTTQGTQPAGGTQPPPPTSQPLAGLAAALPQALPALLPADLLRTRPDVQQAQAEVEQASAQLGLARAALYPRVQLGGSLLYAYNLTQNYRTSSDHMPVFGPLIDIPLFDWGQRQARAQAQAGALEAALLGYRHSVLQAVAEVESALAALAAQRQRVAALQTSLNQAQAQAHVAQRHQQLGLGSIWSALPSARAVLQSQRALADAQAAHALAWVALYKALGGATLEPVVQADAAPGRPQAEAAP